MVALSSGESEFCGIARSLPLASRQPLRFDILCDNPAAWGLCTRSEDAADEFRVSGEGGEEVTRNADLSTKTWGFRFFKI